MACEICGCSESRWLPVNTVAQKFGCTPKSVRRLIKLGEIEGVKFGRLWRVDHLSLDAYVSKDLMGFPGMQSASFPHVSQELRE